MFPKVPWAGSKWCCSVLGWAERVRAMAGVQVQFCSLAVRQSQLRSAASRAILNGKLPPPICGMGGITRLRSQKDRFRGETRADLLR